MVGVVLFIFLICVVLGIIGFVVTGLFYLFIIGVILFIITILASLFGVGNRRRRPTETETREDLDRHPEE